MHTARKRKPPKSGYKPIVIDDYEVEKPRKSQRFIQTLSKYRLHILLFLTILLFLLYVYWPVPKLSTHARHWRDSGYLFEFEGNGVFYQDIISLRQPVRLQPTLLVLHGFPTSSYDWKDLIPDLHKRFPRIIIPDMLGLGFSDKPKDHKYRIKEQATIVEKLLSSLNVSDVHILSHDYGDSVAQELVARGDDPEHRLVMKIKSLCLTNGGILPEYHRPLLIQKLMLVPVLRTVLSRLSNSHIFKASLSSVFGPDTQPSSDDLRDFWSIVRHKEGNLVLSDVLQYIPERQENKERWVAALQHTGIPIHLIYGPMDPVNTPDIFLSNYKRLIPNSIVSVLDNTGHYPHLENKVDFMKYYNEFLDGVENEFYKL